MLPRFHLITDVETRDRDASTLLIAVVGEDLTVTPRVDAVQVRAKQASDREVVAGTRELPAELAPRRTRAIVDDRLDLALAAGAHGVHLDRDDLSVADAWALDPAGFLVGAACRGPEHVTAARAEGADHSGVGPVHATSSKDGLPDTLDLDVLAATAPEIPAIALGGTTAARVRDVMTAGAHGVAVVAAVRKAPDPPGAAREIAELVHAS